jgi:2'-5' RNA ligase
VSTIHGVASLDGGARCREDEVVFSVEVTVDAAADEAVRADWARLVEAGLPSSGRNPSPTNRPHVTLAVREQVDPTAVAGAVGLLPIPLELGGILLFGHRGQFVLARQVVVTAALLALHRAVADSLGPPEPRYANTGLDRWSPHVTLARRLDAQRVAEALAVIEAQPITAQATGLRIWDASAKQITTLR